MTTSKPKADKPAIKHPKETIKKTAEVFGYDLSGMTIEKTAFGVIFAALGAYLCFAGKRFFKVFLALIGFAAAGLLTLQGLLYLDGIWDFGDNRKLIYLTVTGICGLIGGAVGMLAWRIGVYACAGAGGYMAGTWLMATIASITNHVSRQTFLVITTIAAIVLVTFFDELVVKLASAILGAALLASGLDCFLETGYNELLLTVMYERVPPESLSKEQYGMLGGVAVVAALGFLVQSIYGGRGFGRKN